MSTRWYPLYQKGNPQLRVFLPNFWMKLIAPPDSQFKQPPNTVQFHCSMEMTKHDIKNYLEKIYNVNVIAVRTKITLGNFKRDEFQGAVIKEDDKKIAYVILPKGQLFTFPDLFKDTKSELDPKAIDEAKKDLQTFLEPNKTPGLPAWFRV